MTSAALLSAKAPLREPAERRQFTSFGAQPGYQSRGMPTGRSCSLLQPPRRRRDAKPSVQGWKGYQVSVSPRWMRQKLSGNQHEWTKVENLSELIISVHGICRQVIKLYNDTRDPFAAKAPLREQSGHRSHRCGRGCGLTNRAG